MFSDNRDFIKTRWGLTKMAGILQTTFSNAILRKNVYFDSNFTKVCSWGDKPLSEPMLYCYHPINIANLTPRNKLQWNFNRNLHIFIEGNTFENVVCKMLPISCWPQCVNVFHALFHQDVIQRWWQWDRPHLTHCPLGDVAIIISLVNAPETHWFR